MKQPGFRFYLRPSRKAPAALLMAAFLSLSGCLMGGGSDQPNKVPEWSGTVRGLDGQEMSGARVSLYKGTYHPGYDATIAPSQAVAIADAGTDAKGAFSLAKPGVGDYFLQGLSADSAAIAVSGPLDTFYLHRTLLPDVKLAEAASLEGSITSSSPVLSLHLAGTHFLAIPDSTGHFAFGPLPAGEFWLIARLGGNAADAGERFAAVRTVGLSAGTALSMPGLRAEKDLLLLFDFESGDGFSNLRGLTYPYAQPAGSRVGAWKPLPQATDTVGAYRGRSYHVLLKQGQTYGFALGNGYYNLSKLTAFTFQARGKGHMDVTFHTGLISPPDPSLHTSVTLDSVWRKVSILPADIIVAAGSTSEQKGYTWDKAKDQVAKITFVAKEANVELWLDDVAIEGMDFRDLGPALPAGLDAFP